MNAFERVEEARTALRRELGAERKQEARGRAHGADADAWPGRGGVLCLWRQQICVGVSERGVLTMDLTGGRYLGIFGVPGPVKTVAFPMNGFMTLYCLTPQAQEELYADSGGCIWPFGVGPIGIIVIGESHQ